MYALKFLAAGVVFALGGLFLLGYKAYSGLRGDWREYVVLLAFTLIGCFFAWLGWSELTNRRR